MQTISEVKKHFAQGAESVTLTRDEWQSIMDVCHSYAATGTQLGKATAETERIKRIAKPLWRACKVVAAQMRRSMLAGTVTRSRIEDWEMWLRHATDVDWRDLPPGHRLRARSARH